MNLDPHNHRPDHPIHVVKLGGSLLDLPDLAGRFEAFRGVNMTGHRGVLVVGGGDAAQQVRRLDLAHKLREDIAHWLAIRAMQFNTYTVAAVLPRARLVADSHECLGAWSGDDLAVVDPLAWLEDEHRNGVTLPHRWSFTSDSIAAHIATRLGAQRLTLLKSTLPESPRDIAAAADRGVIDPDFAQASSGIPQVELINLRTQPATGIRLR